MSALDDLLRQWRSNPDADATIALCSFLGTSSREALIREVSASAETWHAEEGSVMLAVGRMHLDAGLLAEAQAALVAASKANGRDAKPFRYLGEVLLRRGDAVRAEKVLARALQFGPNDPEAGLWHDRSVVYSALQTRIGVEAVAAEVLRAMPKRNSIPAPTMAGLSHKPFGNEAPTKPRSQNPFSNPAGPAADALPRFESEDPLRVSESDLLEESSPRLSALAAVGRATTLGMGPPGPKLPSAAPSKASVAVARANPLSSKLGNASAPSASTKPAAPTRPAAIAAARSAPAAPRLEADPKPRPPAAPERFEESVTTITPAPFIAPSWPEGPSLGRSSLPLPAMPPAPIAAPPAASGRSALAVAETMAAPSFASPV